MKPLIAIAGGGTGGHVFPGLAVADALSRLADVDICFYGTARGIESRVVPAYRNANGKSYALELLAVDPMVGGGPARAVQGGLKAGKAVIAAVAMLRKRKPAVVLSVGGYAAGPIGMAAATLRIPLAILEPNAVMGLTNRWLAPFATRGYGAWDEVVTKFARKGCLVGVPLRAAFKPQPYQPHSPKRVLVLGGSGGAKAMNERMPHVMARLKALNVTVVHQTGRDRDDAVRKAYAQEDVKNVTVVPFLDDVADALARTDVIIARSGAGTVAEIAAVGRASILIPFPFAADDHQAKNAQALSARGGALFLREEAADDARIANELAGLLTDDARLVQMAKSAESVGRTDAAEVVARDLLTLGNVRERSATETEAETESKRGATVQRWAWGGAH